MVYTIVICVKVTSVLKIKKNTYMNKRQIVKNGLCINARI